MKIIEVSLEDVDLTEAKIQVNFSEVKICMAEVNTIKMHTKANIKTIGTKAIITKAEEITMAMVATGLIIEVILTTNTISIMVMMMSTRQINMVHHVHYAVDITTLLLNIVLRENTISMILWKI